MRWAASVLHPQKGPSIPRMSNTRSTFPLHLVWIFPSSFYALNFLPPHLFLCALKLPSLAVASSLSHSQVLLPTQTTWRSFPCLQEDNQLHPLTLSGQTASNRKCLWNGWWRHPDLIVRKACQEAKLFGVFHSEIFLLSGHKAVGEILNWKIYFRFVLAL